MIFRLTFCIVTFYVLSQLPFYISVFVLGFLNENKTKFQMSGSDVPTIISN